MKKRNILASILIVALATTLSPIQTSQAASVSAAPPTTIIAGYDSNSYVVKADGSLWSWGYYNDCRLGIGRDDSNTSDKYGYSPVKILDGVASIYSKQRLNNFFAIKTDGSLWGWGYNEVGQLGDGTKISRNKPVKIMDGVRSVSIGGSCIGDAYTCVIKKDGSLWAWGSIAGDIGISNKPTKIAANVLSVATGHRFIMFIKTDGSLWACGKNFSGELGDGTNRDKTKPVKIMDKVASVTISESSTMAVKKDGSLWAWGLNDAGQLGDGTTVQRNKPVKVMGGVASVYLYISDSIYKECTMAIKTDGSLWAWGYNGDGELGDGTEKNRTKPVKIMSSGAAYVAFPALEENGDNPIVVLKTDGSLWSWMGNPGADGHSRTFYTRSPVKVMSDALSVSVGSTHVMALKKDGTVWSWGILSYNPTAVYQKIPSLTGNTTPAFYETNCKIFSQRRIDPGYIPDFLQPVYDDEVTKKAKEITAGISDDYDKAKAIYDWMYKEAAFSSLSDHMDELAARIPHLGEGISTFMDDLLNASGIPARTVEGSLVNKKTGKHEDVAWNEAFVDGRWIIMDASRGDDEWFDVSLEHFSETYCYNDYIALTYGETSSAVPMKMMDGGKIPTGTK